MLDNKPLEQEALNCITSKVSRYGYKYSHPNFDKKGGDFFIIEELKDGLQKVVTCQSKGRNITNNNSNLKIHKTYVKDSFLLFLYLKDENYDKDDIAFIFTKDEILSWELKEDIFYLNIPKNSLNNTIFTNNEFNKISSKIILDTLIKIDNSQVVEGNTITNLNTLSNLLALWKNIGSLPDSNLTKQILDDFDNFPYVNIEELVFLLCIAIHNEESLGIENSIDWSFQYLMYYNETIIDEEYISNFTIQKKAYSSFMITYNKTYLEYLKNNKEKGFKLQIGDSEEYVECYLFQNGEYFLKYKKTGKKL